MINEKEEEELLKKSNKFIQKNKLVKPIVCAYGRMNPPTTGHAKLLSAVVSIASKIGGIPVLFLSRSENSLDNPLPYQTKFSYIKKMFPQVKIIDDERLVNPFIALKFLSEVGFSNVILVTGRDREEKYDQLAVSVKDSFNKFQVHCIGNRIPHSLGVEGMSSSKMRRWAMEGKMGLFYKGLPTADKKLAWDIWSKVRSGLNEASMDCEPVVGTGKSTLKKTNVTFTKLNGPPGESYGAGRAVGDFAVMAETDKPIKPADEKPNKRTNIIPSGSPEAMGIVGALMT